MAKITVSLNIEVTKTEFTATDIEDIINWIKTNVINNLPSNAAANFHLIYSP